MQPNHLTYLAAQREQITISDQLDGQRLVADGVGKHRHLATVVALYRALTPLSVRHPRADREESLCCG
jgi:hypothetical protein